MIRKEGEKYVLRSKSVNPRTGKRRVLGRFDTREQAQAHERRVQFFKNRGAEERS